MYCLSTSHRTNEHENYLALLSVGFTLSTQGDTSCIGVKLVRQLIIKGWEKSTETAQPEQLCLEHDICGFVAITSITNAWRNSYLAKKAIVTGWHTVSCASCLVGKVTGLLDGPGSCCHWKCTSTDSGDRNVQVKVVEKKLVVLPCNESMKGSWLQWVRQTCKLNHLELFWTYS